MTDTDHPGSATLPSFLAVAASVTDYLSRTIPMTVWAVSRYDGDHQIFLAVAAENPHVTVGDQISWDDSACKFMVAGAIPHIVPNTSTLPVLAHLVAHSDVIGGAYVGMPIKRGDGSLFGTLCGLDPAPGPQSLTTHQPLFDVFAEVLAQALESDYHRAEAERAADLARTEADTDALTGLWNRRAWNRFLRTEEERHSSFADPGAIIAIDLDRLKAVNDTYGHAAGDDYIRRAANALRQAAYPHTVARLGGDEFGVLALDSPPAKVNDLITAIEAQFADVSVSSTIGSAPLTVAGGTVAAWQRADHAMYARKRRAPSPNPTQPTPTQPTTRSARHRRPESGEDAHDEPFGADLDLHFAGRVGTFAYSVGTGEWYWSPEIYRMYGYQVGKVDVTTALWASHHHADDRTFTSSVFNRAEATGLPFQYHHRLIDTEGRTHYMLAVGGGEIGPSGQVERVRGRLIDLTGA